MRNLLTFLIFVFALALFPDTLSAQCGMCKAVLESSAETGNKLVEGVNNGILYMMGVPYLLLFVVGFAWYKKFGKTILKK